MSTVVPSAFLYFLSFTEVSVAPSREKVRSYRSVWRVTDSPCEGGGAEPSVGTTARSAAVEPIAAGNGDDCAKPGLSFAAWSDCAPLSEAPPGGADCADRESADRESADSIVMPPTAMTAQRRTATKVFRSMACKRRIFSNGAAPGAEHPARAARCTTAGRRCRARQTPSRSIRGP